MKKKYIVKEKFIGKVVFDIAGKHILSNKLPQKELKDLFTTGHTEKIELIEYAAKKDISDSQSSTDNGE